MMQHHLVKKFYNADFGLLIIRIGLGAAFISHGWMKIENIHGIVGFFGTIGLPAFLAYLITALEFVGGVAILLGVYASVFGTLLAIEMLFAIALVARRLVVHAGFSGMELEFILLTVSLGIALAGSGRYAIIDCKR
jgi:uncharacterized membrane protein YphA (DoxX/SURF4 family)